MFCRESHHLQKVWLIGDPQVNVVFSFDVQQAGPSSGWAGVWKRSFPHITASETLNYGCRAGRNDGRSVEGCDEVELINWCLLGHGSSEKRSQHLKVTVSEKRSEANVCLIE
jgi:hypothetical protein